MKRRDLTEMKYKGWQVMDATPQERSEDGRFHVGPSPVHAVKNGEVETPFDTPFIYSEVNADTIYWKFTGRKNPIVRFKSDTDRWAPLSMYICKWVKSVGKSDIRSFGM
jgi:transglutaminase 1